MTSASLPLDLIDRPGILSQAQAGSLPERPGALGPGPSGSTGPGVAAEFDSDMSRAPKRQLHSAVGSRTGERGVGGMQVNSWGPTLPGRRSRAGKRVRPGCTLNP